MRLPYRTRFAIILNEFGAGLAGRGKDVRAVIRGANPALRQFDRVIKILANQNKQLAAGAKSGDKVLAEWAARRKQVADFIVKANITAQATAERRADLEKNFQKFPKFLQELRPTMARLGSLSQQMLPVFRNLNQVGPEVSRLLIALGPFSRAGIPAFRTLGQTAKSGPPTLTRDSTLGGLSDEAGPQPASPISSEQLAATSQQRGANSKKIRALDCSLLTIRFTRDRKRYEITPIAE